MPVKTLYAWVKDADGNISNAVTHTVDVVDITLPTSATIIRLDATDGNVSESFNEETSEVIAIRVDSTDHTATIISPTGFTINGGSSYSLFVKDETVRLVRHGNNFITI